MSNSRYQIGAYYFPNYHLDPRNEAVHGKGWTEWELVKHALPRFENHDQPKVPAWGYEDEADPRVMARKIDAAADHGLDHFIFDWYWYNDGPYLNRPLDEAFLRAGNNGRLKFCLMWANHNWKDIHPARLNGYNPLLYPGAVTRDTWETIGDYCIENYFRHPSYKLIDGCPYFSIYDLSALIESFGGREETREALDAFRHKVQNAGFPDLNLNAIVWGNRILPGETAVANPVELLDVLGFDSVGSYVWVHHASLPQFPVTPYGHVAEQAMAHWRRSRDEFSLPFYPNVTMGWDASPRTIQSDTFQNAVYPFMATIGENTPQAFKRGLEAVKSFLDERPDGPKMFSINAWNEWTEGSYLEPDTKNGMAYLEAIRDVFKAETT